MPVTSCHSCAGTPGRAAAVCVSYWPVLTPLVLTPVQGEQLFVSYWPVLTSLVLSPVQGEQLFVSYLDESMGLRHRQEHLRFSYGFKCGCQRCVEEEQDEASTR